jgi:hypothetical protein
MEYGELLLLLFKQRSLRVDGGGLLLNCIICQVKLLLEVLDLKLKVVDDLKSRLCDLHLSL